MNHDFDVLILGGSFTGIEIVRRLHRDRVGRTLRIAVVDRQREHLYIPLGHELLCERLPYGVEAGTVLASAAYVEGLGATWVQGELASFDPARQTATLSEGRELSARFVVFALGSEIRAPQSVPGSERLLAYKSEAEFARAREALVRSPEAEVLVVGGGITGVEIAGELAHRTRAKVTLIHAGDRLLQGLCERAGRKALAALQAQGVEVRLHTRLLAVHESSALVHDRSGEQTLACALGFWAGGLRPPAVIEQLGLALDHAGWVIVDPELRCGEDRFAGGDLARIYATPDATWHWPTMQRAIEGIFAATTIAANIVARVRGRALRRHRLWSDFPHGVSLGARSLVVVGRLVIDAARIDTWFRRFLMRQYMRRYRARPRASPPSQ
ncbi:NAD(P)/FAD-dependent oxidoreductase [Nannocystaceae bacterium ST9]